MDAAVSVSDFSRAVVTSLETIGSSKCNLKCTQCIQPDCNASLWQTATTRGHTCCKQFTTADEQSYGCQGMVSEKVRTLHF